MSNVLKIKMIDKQLTPIGCGDIKGEWFDLRFSDVYTINGIDIEEQLDRIDDDCLIYKKGDVLFLGLGFAADPGKGNELIIAPRSSTFKNYGFLLTNSIGVGDSSYRGEYKALIYCTRDGFISYDDRFLQMRVQKQQDVNIELVNELSETERGNGGFGSTGVN